MWTSTRLLLANGFAVVNTHRTTTENRGEITATLEDGKTVDYIAFNDTAQYIIDFAEVAKKAIVDRQRFFDGLLNDDPAAGTWYPVVMKDGRDVLFATDAAKAAFVPQIDVTHLMYNNIWPPKHPAWMSSSYLENKRKNAKILRDKGLAAKYRMHEVRSVSHSGGETLTDAKRGAIETLDLSK
jgi:hypothetical protein